MSRRTAAVQTVQRFRLVLLLHEQPSLRYDEAAEAVGLSARQVQRWRSRWAAGDFSIEDHSGRGRKAAFPPLDQASIRAMACEAVAETTNHSVANRWRTWCGEPERRWVRTSAAARCVVRCTMRRSSPGNTSTGFFHETLGLPRRPGRSSTFMRERGKTNLWARRITCCVWMRRRAFKHVDAAMQKCRPSPSRAGGLKRNTTGMERSNTWQRGTCIAGWSGTL